MRKIISLSLLIFCLLNAETYAKEQVESDRELMKTALNDLRATISDIDKYRDSAKKITDSLSQTLAKIPARDLEKRMHLNMQLANALKGMNADSAVICSQNAVELALQLNSEEAIASSRLNLISSLKNAGIYIEAFSEYDQMKDLPMSESMKIDYWMEGKRLYDRMALALPENNFYRIKYRQRSDALADSLLSLLPRGDLYHRFLWANKMYYAGRYQDADNISEALLPFVNSGTELYSDLNYLQALISRKIDSEYAYAYFLCRTADNNIKMWDSGTAVIPELANWLANNDAEPTAYNLLIFYLSYADVANSRSLPISMVSSLPTLEKNYTRSLRNMNTGLWILAILSLIFAAIAILLLIKYYRDRNKFKRMTDELENQARLQSSYMGSFIELCTVYSERLENLRNLTIRKIQTGKADDLLNMMKNGKASEPHMDNFYKIFDTAFLDLYPMFIERVNSLLEPDSQIGITRKDTLTPELRIYALVRMGITEGVKISQILHYSPNTVYSYRNKLRNKAISRDTFDSGIMLIPAGWDSIKVHK